MINFAYNPTSWDPSAGVPWPGGMADRLVGPILPHLGGQWSISDMPRNVDVNVYLTFRRLYRGAKYEPGRVSVFMSHGIADKNWREAAKVTAEFDYVCVSGPAWTERMIAGGLPHRRVLEVGYPKLDPLFTADRVAAVDDRIRVLWAPTHGGGGEGAVHSSSARSTWSRSHEILDRLDPDRFDVTVAAHPRHSPGHRATFDEYLSADVVIADGGSTIYEAWALGLPVVFCDWLTAAGNLMRRPGSWTFEAEIYQAQIGRHAHHVDELADVLVDAHAGGITSAEELFVEPILPAAYRGRSAAMHAEVFDALAVGRPPVFTAQISNPVTFIGPRGQRIVVAAGSAQAERFRRSARWQREEVTVDG